MYSTCITLKGVYYKEYYKVIHNITKNTYNDNV